jgi:hypothetical protein
MAESTTTVQVAADATGLVAELRRAAGAVVSFKNNVEHTFDQIENIGKKLLAPFLAVSAIVKGGEFFGDMVKDAIAWDTESVKLGKTLGTTSEEASKLKVALHGQGIEVSTYTNVAGAMVRQIASGGQGFKKLGIDVRDAHGNLKPISQLIAESTEKLATFQAGTARNTAAQLIAKKGWQDLLELMKLTPEAMAEAAAKAEELNLVTGPERAASTLAYKKAIRELELACDALKIQIGQSLIPALTALAEWMGDKAPNKASFLSTAIKGISIAIVALGTFFESLAIRGSAIFESLGELGAGVGRALKTAFSITGGDSALDMLKGSAAAAKSIIMKSEKDLEALQAKAGATMEKLLDKKGFTVLKTNLTDFEVKKGGADIDTSKEKRVEPNAALIASWKRDFELIKAAKTEWETWDKADELAFWEQKLAEANAKGSQFAKAQMTALHEVNRLKEDLRKEDQALQRETEKQAVASKLAAIEMEEQLIKQDAAMKRITWEEEAASILALERKKLEIKRESLAQQMALEGTSKLDKLKLQGEEAVAVTALDKKRLDFFREAENKRAQILKEKQKEIEGYVQPFVQGFSGGIKKMLDGTITFGQAIKGMGGMIRDAFADMIGQMVTNWIKKLAEMLAAWVTNLAQELIFHEATQEAKKTATIGSATGRVAAESAAGAAAAGASAASVPGIGWMIAIPVALAVLGGLMALMGSIKGAAGGFDIPSGMNPLTQLHAEEMVLPAGLANTVRNLTRSGGGVEAGMVGGGAEVNLHISAVDGPSVARFFRSNQDALAKVIRQGIRDGKGRKR